MLPWLLQCAADLQKVTDGGGGNSGLDLIAIHERAGLHAFVDTRPLMAFRDGRRSRLRTRQAAIDQNPAPQEREQPAWPSPNIPVMTCK